MDLEKTVKKYDDLNKTNSINEFGKNLFFSFYVNFF